MEMYAYLEYTAAGSAGTGDYFFHLPTPYQFATGVQGAKPWSTSGTADSNVGSFSGSAGTWYCTNLTNSYYEIGTPKVYNASKVRMLTMSNQNTVEWYWGSTSGICSISADNYTYALRLKAKISGWCDAGTSCATGD